MSRVIAPVTEHAQAKTSVRWKIFLMLLLLVTVNYIDRASLSVAMPMIASEFTLTPVMQGLIMSSFFWSYTLMQIPGGMAVDRFKPRLVLALCTLLWGAFQGLGAVTTNAVSLLLTRLGLGVAEAPVASAGGALNAMWLTQHERVRGASLMDGGSPLGAALGSLLIAWLIVVAHSWRAAFAIAGVGTILCGIGTWFYIKNQPREHAGVNEAEAEHIEQARQHEYEKEAKELSGNSIDFFKYRSVILMFVGFMCCTTLYYGLLTWMPTYLHKVHGFDIQQMGGASFIIFFCGFIGELVGGYVADKWLARGAAPNLVMRTIFGVAGAVATVAVFSVAHAKSPTTVVILLSITLFFLRWGGLYWSIPAMLATRHKVGVLGGLLNFGGNIGGMVIPIVIGAIVQYTGSYFLALMCFAAMGVGLMLCSVGIDFETKIPV
ncbi:MFS transporter [Caballeronia mineralivorans]|jgi:ACS family D-galactonate transporter-like MFS transporter|uniref:MFS transporter n=1 Tax=Caballeronia mineralivorans TaxID=2010198 RepID=UPI0023F0D50F|nr:MFS transporter [Caballeronia mineralivorans]MDB5785144.1 major Facilitator Superfamily protein [Caballeronia mineralivorans]MEA3096247.1 transporter, family, D-galactonate transporter [Caballeronia mineralivorans]